MSEKMNNKEAHKKPKGLAFKPPLYATVQSQIGSASKRHEEIASKQKYSMECSLESWKKNLSKQFSIDNISEVFCYPEDSINIIDDFLPESQPSAQRKKQVPRKNSKLLKQVSDLRETKKKKNIQRILVSTLKTLSQTKKEVDQLRETMRIQKNRSFNLFTSLSSKYLQFQSQWESQFSLQIFRLAYKNINEKNQQLLRKNTELQRTIYSLKKGLSQNLHLKQLQVSSIINEFQKSKNKNYSLNLQCQKLKQEKNLLEEQIFNLKQKQKGLDLEVESRVQNILDQFCKSSTFFSQKQKSKNKSSRQCEYETEKPILNSTINSWNSQLKIPRKSRRTHTDLSDERKEQASHLYTPSTISTVCEPKYSRNTKKTGIIKLFEPTRKDEQKKYRFDKKSYLNSSFEAVDNKLKKMKAEISLNLRKLKSKYQ